MRFPVAPRLEFQSSPSAAAPLFDSAESDPVSEPWDTVLFHGSGGDAGVAYEFSRRRFNGSWTPWTRARVERFPGGRFWGKALVPGGRGSLRMRAIDAGVRAREAVSIYGVEVFDSSDTESPASGAPGQPPVQPRPTLHPRQEWSARAPKEPFTPHQPVKITLHHTSGGQPQTLDEGLREVRFIQRFHQDGRGWNDIAYHFLVDAAGRVYEGRPEGVVGAHTKDNNTGNVGIVLLGTHHGPANHPISAAAFDSLVAIGKYLAAAYTVSFESVKGHRDYKATDCPGDLAYPKLADLRAALKPQPAPVPPAPAPQKPISLSLPHLLSWDGK